MRAPAGPPPGRDPEQRLSNLSTHQIAPGVAFRHGPLSVTQPGSRRARFPQVTRGCHRHCLEVPL